MEMKYAVSIHAPARGATLMLKRKFSFKSFNPRARAGRDESISIGEWIDRVSIHAPARGATA